MSSFGTTVLLETTLSKAGIVSAIEDLVCGLIPMFLDISSRSNFIRSSRHFFPGFSSISTLTVACSSFFSRLKKGFIYQGSLESSDDKVLSDEDDFSEKLSLSKLLKGMLLLLELP